MPTLKLVEAYVDGGCSPNPGPGAFAAILKHKDHIKSFVVNAKGTNNQMEMRAAILALDSLKERCEVYIYTDSQYLHNGMTVHFDRWRGNGWRSCNNKKISNLDLWKQLGILRKKHVIHWQWVRGHNGNLYNEQAHDLVQKAMQTYYKQLSGGFSEYICGNEGYGQGIING